MLKANAAVSTDLSLINQGIIPAKAGIHLLSLHLMQENKICKKTLNYCNSEKIVVF